MGKRKNYKIQEKRVRNNSAKIKKGPFPWLKYIIGLVVLSGAVSQLYLFNHLAVLGDELMTLEQKKTSLSQHKTALEQQAVQLSSLSRIEKESREKLGMSAGISSVQYVTPEKVASLR